MTTEQQPIPNSVAQNFTGTPLEQKLAALAQQVLTSLGLEVLDVQVQNPAGNAVVVLRIDRLDEQPVGIDDLSKASRAVGDEYDRLDPIEAEYRLELESPGAKRPLTRKRHFERMLGLKARVRADGHAFTAPIKAVHESSVTFDVSGEDVTLEIAQMQANLAEFPDKHR